MVFSSLQGMQINYFSPSVYGMCALGVNKYLRYVALFITMNENEHFTWMSLLIQIFCSFTIFIHSQLYTFIYKTYKTNCLNSTAVC